MVTRHGIGVAAQLVQLRQQRVDGANGVAGLRAAALPRRRQTLHLRRMMRRWIAAALLRTAILPCPSADHHFM